MEDDQFMADEMKKLHITQLKDMAQEWGVYQENMPQDEMIRALIKANKEQTPPEGKKAVDEVAEVLQEEIEKEIQPEIDRIQEEVKASEDKSSQPVVEEELKKEINGIEQNGKKEEGFFVPDARKFKKSRENGHSKPPKPEPKPDIVPQKEVQRPKVQRPKSPVDDMHVNLVPRTVAAEVMNAPTQDEVIQQQSEQLSNKFIKQVYSLRPDDNYAGIMKDNKGNTYLQMQLHPSDVKKIAIMGGILEDWGSINYNHPSQVGKFAFQLLWNTIQTEIGRRKEELNAAGGK